MEQIDPGHHFEQFAGDMVYSSVASLGHRDLARFGLGVGDELKNRIGRNRWMDLHDHRRTHNTRDRCYVTDEIEIEVLIERRADCVRPVDHQQCVAIWSRAHDHLGAYISAGAHSVLDDKWLAEPL